MWWVLARLILTAFFAGAVLLSSRELRAETPLVTLDLRDCPRLDSASVRRIFEADLGTQSGTEPNPYITEVSIGCEAERVVVRVRDPLSRKTVKRSFDSTSFGNRGEARLVAIAASELVLASWAELSANPELEVEPEGPKPSAETLRSARDVVRARTPATRSRPPDALATKSEETPPVRTLETTTRPQTASEAAFATQDLPQPQPKQKPPADDGIKPPVVRVLAVASMREFFTGDGTLYGGGARLAEDRARIASWAADMLIENGNLRGKNVTSFTLGGLLQGFVDYHWLTLRGGAGLRAGILGVDGGPQLGTFGWPLATAGISIWAHEIVVDVGGEIGYGVLPIGGDSQPSVRGGWASGQIGVGLVL